MSPVYPLTTLLLAAIAAAQTTVLVDPASHTCSAGAVTQAAASVTFDYNPATAILRVVVANTSPVKSGLPNPLITKVYWNVPSGMVTGAQLLSQTGSGGATPNFELSFDADTSTKPATNHGNCFGSFNFGLDLQGIHGGIANPNATIFGGPAGSWVVGPVTFDIQLTGPEVANLTSDTFASATSSNGGQRETNVFVKWQAGVNGESIELGNNQECLTSVYIRGEPRIGNTIQVCAGGSNGCHACIQFSAYPGPTMFMGYVVEIGLPLMGSIDLGSFSGGITELCVPIRIPNRPVLIGQHFYFVNAGTLPSNPSILVFSPGYEIVILP